jgi:hypothetical protein
MRHAHRLALAAAALAATTASATTLDRPPLRQMIEEADLVFEGVVTGVVYRNSTVHGPDDVARPHAFVTYDVLRTFKGRSAAGSAIVLRMLGGPRGNGRTLMVSGIPTFRTGDHDLLFVRGNELDACPLAGWEHGRFRVVEGLVRRDDGLPVWLSADDELTDAPEADEAPPAGFRPADAGTFAQTVERRVHERYDEGTLAQLPPAASADSALPFRVRRLAETPAPPDPAGGND